MWLIILYLLAAVLANLSVLYFGPIATPFNAFFLIALDLTTRDGLHERWQGKNLWLRMFCLIIAGGFISWFFNREVLQIAIASAVSFFIAGLSDTIVYQVLFKKPRFVKLNGSNIVSATVDSFLFPTIAFGGFIWWATVGQLFAKIVGGYVWSLILRKVLWNKEDITDPIEVGGGKLNGEIRQKEA